MIYIYRRIKYHFRYASQFYIKHVDLVFQRGNSMTCLKVTLDLRLFLEQGSHGEREDVWSPRCKSFEIFAVQPKRGHCQVCGMR